MYPLLSAIVHQTQADSMAKWKLLSKQICDSLVPQLHKRTVDLNSMDALDVLNKLLSNLDPSALHEALFGLLQNFADTESEAVSHHQVFRNYVWA